MIFITIAAYRDPELWPTVEHALAMAKHPDALEFAICLQDEPEKLHVPSHLANAKIKLIGVPYQESKGCCWARARLQEVYAGQEYTLQLDSHHRFVRDWDAQLIEMLTELEQHCERPMITSYLPPYEPDTPLEVRQPCKIVATKFSDDWATVHFAPRYFCVAKPMRTAFVSAHFFFCRGQFHHEIAYDAEIYFTGEEDTLAQRLFTHGWQLYAPHKTLAYHYYTRAQRAKHWEDNPDWWKLNEVALERVDAVLDGEQSSVGCGPTPIEEYWQFSGINYVCQTLQPWAKHGFTALHLSTTPTDLWIHSEGYFQRKEGHWVENNRCRFQQTDTLPPTLHDPKRDLSLTFDKGCCWYLDQVLYRGHWIKNL